MKGTRERVVAEALKLFRRKGFDKTTMRDVAEAVGLSLGAAYYYFASKEAIVLAYYDEHQRAHAERARARMAEASTTRERLGAVFHTNLDLLARDRKLLGALFRYVGDPTNPAGLFGDTTAGVRKASLSLFAEAIADEPLDEPTKELAALSLWSLHMGLLLFFLHDTSPKQEKTRRLVDGSLDIVATLLPLGPLLAPVLTRVSAVLAEAGLTASP